MNDLSDNLTAVTALRKLADAMETGAPVEGTYLDHAIGALLDHRPRDPCDLRKLVLRRFWQKFYPGMRRSRAAVLIASDWKTARATGFAEPGSRDDFFRRLEAAGFRRVGIRTIIDDLDYDL